MRTKNLHLEQRVAALQSDLNQKDEQIDALEFKDKDRELSRRDWFDEAQRLEKENEELRSDVEKQRRLKMLVAEKLQNALNNCSVYRVQLAERDALLSEIRGAMREYEQGCDQFPPFHHNRLMERIEATLSASSEPKSCGACAGCEDGCRVDRESPPVDLTEKAEFKKWHLSAQIGERGAWSAWQARAALERKP
ncbi:hypothetical protein H7A76_24460 [Pseudomonas sp. MSSRFD41]|uniref:hypothetical protein n=1 Tax=Pseudomonas sp. MSSRFD41 TaxID=1310370 RepID=UPI00163A560C|nr:hypothetical protein [Pseudomonas sp. MSSRFD41]MBC2658603.1 hypothetical protein [Pseudomonas sp. MSSRFD41]